LASIIELTPGIYGLLCLPECNTTQSSFAHLFRLTPKGNAATAGMGKRFNVSTSISILRKLTKPNGRGKKFPEPNPSGWCIRLVLLMLHLVTLSCLVT
jgi:hypothetical protein